MQEKSPSFKSPSKKHQPKGLTILYEDQDILVVDKINGLLTVGSDREKHKTAHFILNQYVKKGNVRSKNRVFIVHRLDRDTSGILVFAKNEKAKRYLQERWKDFSKKYFAVVQGTLQEKEGEITSYLVENKAHRMYSVKDPEKGKFAKTGYKVLKASSKNSLLEIKLFTGRKNQIRVHFSEKGHPVVGDKMYGDADKGIRRLGLHSASLTISHPFTKKEMSFETEIPAYFKSLVHFKSFEQRNKKNDGGTQLSVRTSSPERNDMQEGNNRGEQKSNHGGKRLPGRNSLPAQNGMQAGNEGVEEKFNNRGHKGKRFKAGERRGKN